MTSTKKYCAEARCVSVLLVGLAMLWMVPFAIGWQETTPPRQLDAAWTKAYPNPEFPRLRPMSVTISENGRCAAVAANGTLEVINSTGRTTWRWDYGQINRFITPGTLAISPFCDAIAMAGNSGYKYTWVADRQGHSAYVRTASTPLAVTFDHEGKFVAIGTGGEDVLLITRRGKLKWKRTLEQGWGLVGQLSFSSDNRSILVRGGYLVGALDLDGGIVWSNTGLIRMSAARDLQTFVGWFQPGHGTSHGIVVALDRAGKELWTKDSQDPGAVISPSGDRIVARLSVGKQPSNTKPKQTPRNEDSLDEDDCETALQVVSRDGAVLTTLPVQDGTPIAISPDGERVLVRTQFGIEALELNGNRLFGIPLARWHFDDALVAEDFSALLIVVRNGTNEQLKWYNLK